MSDLQQWQASVPRDFVARAACRGMEPELFMPTVGQNGAEAKRVCNGRQATFKTPGLPPCPVKRECLEYALSIPGPVVGVWGGTSEKDRRKLKTGIPLNVRRSVEHGTVAGYQAHMRNKTRACPACRDANAVANEWNKKLEEPETKSQLAQLIELVRESNATSRTPS